MKKSKKRKKKWRPYIPTAYDLQRDASLAEPKPFSWQSYRKFKAEEKKRNE